ncbi:MAG: MFS transporter [Vicinamibacterales bacterium]|nr:MFS transporter [Vicinamibacterales bacterium]HJN45449.1 MFS transporter [Vicinamibacterales bacterium]
MVPRVAPPWYRQIDGHQWRAFLATFFGWLLDGFDFTIMTFILIDIQESFTVDAALAGALGTVTLLFRLVGGLGAGMMADRWGRKLPLMLSILWFSLFAFLSGFSTSYAMLFAFRALFGIGMGGEWAAGMPLALEHWPTRLRGLASGLLQGGWYWGYILSSLTFSYIYPVFAAMPDPFSDAAGSSLGWRVMFWTGVIPALLVLWIRTGVDESPVWLERQRHLKQTGQAALADRVSLMRLLQPDLLWVTIQSSLLLSAFMFSYYSISFWYPTFLREQGLDPLRYLVAFNGAAIVGIALWGRASEGAIGRRGAVTLAALSGVGLAPLFLTTSSTALLLVGALAMGATGGGIWGMAPAYLTERFPTAVRGVGPGLSYHVGAAVGSATPLVLGQLQDGGMTIAGAMTLSIVASGLVVAAVIWLGPETRGRHFTAVDEVQT